MDEVFIYIGTQQNAHFFMHTVADEEKYAANISAQIYNCMIAETIFRKPDEIVIIFDMYEEGKINVVVTQHVDSTTVFKYSPDDLSVQFMRLLRADRRDHNILTFAYKPAIRAYITNELTSEQLPNLQNGIDNIDNTSFNIGNVEYMMTKKPFLS
jgi:hypothetical protein